MTDFRPNPLAQAFMGFASAFPTGMNNLIQLQNVIAQREANETQREFQRSFQLYQANQDTIKHNDGINQQQFNLRNTGNPVDAAKADELEQYKKPLLKGPSTTLKPEDLSTKKPEPGFFGKVHDVFVDIIPGGEQSTTTTPSVQVPQELNNVTPPVQQTNVNVPAKSNAVVTPQTDAQTGTIEAPIDRAKRMLKESKLEALKSVRVAKPHSSIVDGLINDPTVSKPKFLEEVQKYTPKQLSDDDKKLFRKMKEQREAASVIFDKIIKNPAIVGSSRNDALTGRIRMPGQNDAANTLEIRNILPKALKNDPIIQELESLKVQASRIKEGEKFTSEAGGTITGPEISTLFGDLPINFSLDAPELLRKLKEFDSYKAKGYASLLKRADDQGFDISGFEEDPFMTGVTGKVSQLKSRKGQTTATPAASPTPTPKSQNFKVEQIEFDDSVDTNPTPDSMTASGMGLIPSANAAPIHLKGTIGNPNRISPEEAVNTSTEELITIGDAAMQRADEGIQDSAKLIQENKKQVETSKARQAKLAKPSKGVQQAMKLIETLGPEKIKQAFPKLKPDRQQLILQAIDFMKQQEGN